MEESTSPKAAHRRNWRVALAYVALVAGFIWAFSQFYLPGKGFTYVINFGSNNEQSSLSKLRKIDYYLDRHSDGYDAQYYAQIALDPSLQNKQLPRAVDNLPYRARRILMPAAAYVMGLGQPAWILQAYSVLNALCWLLLGWISLRWFPPTGWVNLLRWTGVLFSLGFCVSVRSALLDGPSLLLIAAGVMLVEINRPWLATLVLGLSGLGKETNLLGSAALAPTRGSGRMEWRPAILRGSLTAAPLALWVVYLSLHFGPSRQIGLRNFDLPFAAYGRMWQDTIGSLSGVELMPLANLAMLITLTVQLLYLVLRPQWQQAWWRVGFSFALLMVFLGGAVWEGEPSAASRVLLPMQLAFNVLVPARRWWLPVLLLGNLTLFFGPFMLDPLVSEGYVIRGDRTLFSGSDGRSVTVVLSNEWDGVEREGFNYWTWTSGNSSILIRNPHAESLHVRLKFSVTPNGARHVILQLNGGEIWRTTLAAQDNISANLRDILLKPGENRIDFLTDAPATTVGTDPRLLAFSLANFRIDLLRKQP